MTAKITLTTVPSLEQAEGLRRARRVIDQNFQAIKDAIQRQSQDNSLIAPSLLLHSSLAALDSDDHLQYHTDARGDARYFRENEHVSASSGVADSGKPIILDPDGKIDESMIDDSDISHSNLTELAADDHLQYHNNARGDARYYQKPEHIAVSTGVPDAGKPIVLDGTGKVDESMIDDTDIDHGALQGLSDDDHQQYILADGTRDLTGVQIGVDPVLPQHLVTKAALDSGLAAQDEFLELTDTPSSYVGQGDELTYPRVNVGETALEFFQLIDDLAGEGDTTKVLSANRIRELVIQLESKPTGVLTGSELNIINAGLDVEVEAGSGQIIDSYTTPGAEPVVTELTWPDISKVIATPTTSLIAWIMIQESGTPGIGEIVELSTRPTPIQQRELIYAGLISYDGAAWKDVTNPITQGNVAHQFFEFMKDIIPPLTIEAGGAITEHATLFSLDFALADIWELNRNFHVNPKDPNRQTLGPFVPLSFRYITGGFESVGAIVSVIDPTQWENPTGTLDATVGGGAQTATIQRLWLDQADNFWITWGQNTYSDLEAAEASIGFDTGNSVFSSFLIRDSILLGYIISERTETNWGSDARFIPFVAGQGGGAGGAPITLFTGLTDTPAAYLSQARKQLLVNTLETAVEFDFRPHWRNVWNVGTYYTHEMVLDSPWLMIANKETVDRPAPQPVGPGGFILPDAPAWTTPSFTGVVQSGFRITNITGLFQISRVRIWIEDTSPNAHYRLAFVDNVSGEVSIGEEFDGDIV